MVRVVFIGRRGGGFYRKVGSFYRMVRVVFIGRRGGLAL